jgi:hypothetical protein
MITDFKNWGFPWEPEIQQEHFVGDKQHDETMEPFTC